jgi:hydroxysqualene dehydroxylase
VDRDEDELAGPVVPRTLAVIGAGWAGLASAVEATTAGRSVTVYEMAGQAGGRARDVPQGDIVLDNGQHILIGAYAQTLRLMRMVGVDEAAALLRTPLRIGDAAGRGLYLRAGAPMPAFAAAVLRRAGWVWRDKLSLLVAASGWALRGFRADASMDVGTLTRQLSRVVRDDLIDPLCVAALNTPAGEASAAVFLRVLRDALFSGPGSADLLLPRMGLSELFPRPAMQWLERSGATLRLSRRVQAIERSGDAWRVDGEAFDAVLVATPPGEAARLTATIAPAWATQAAALRYEPIVTVYARAEGTRLSEPMLALRCDGDSPAQFVFDRGQMGGPAGLLAFVISGAGPWVERGTEATVHAVLAQARAELQGQLSGTLVPLQTLTEKRATFRCTPALQRPPMQIAHGLLAAGDYIAGPYPATLEGAMRSAVQAVRAMP